MHVRGAIDVEDVSFSYEENQEVLEHVTLHVRPGETVAVVGPSGLLQVFPEECRIVGDEKAMLYLAKAMLMFRGREQGCSLSFRSGNAPRAALCLTRI